ncbi:MAG TPA: glycosyltransferase family 2 protein [Polyangiaceae bacterium]|nr:glycosyltransferase family 2 protein [Polyangiaceae bacterium]
MIPWLSAALALFAVPVLACSGYLVLLTLLSRQARAPVARETRRDGVASHIRFAVVVPAHDEALGIAATVSSLLAVDYSRELFRVIVIADNCNDDTARRARRAGADVLVRDDHEREGKGHALAFAFEHLAAEGWAEAVVVVDADTIVSTNLLAAFAERIDAGDCAVQARYGVRNPDASWRTRLMTIAFATFHELRSSAREKLLVSCGLRGNGMAFTMALLRDVPFDAFSVVEDIEYGARLAEAGHRVRYAGEAHVLGEMTSGEHASRSQRRRWEDGRRRLARALVPRLARRALHDRIALDLAVDLVVPPLSVLVSLTLLGASASLALAHFEAPGGLLAAALWGASGLALLAHVLRGWQLSGTGLRGLAGFVFAIPYLAWKLTLPLRGGPRATGWVRTEREAGGR